MVNFSIENKSLHYINIHIINLMETKHWKDLFFYFEAPSFLYTHKKRKKRFTSKAHANAFDLMVGVTNTDILLLRTLFYSSHEQWIVSDLTYSCHSKGHQAVPTEDRKIEPVQSEITKPSPPSAQTLTHRTTHK